MTTPSRLSKLYNRNPPHGWTLKSPKIMSPSFYFTELNKALSEQAFGLARFDVQSSTPHEATASVTLLEGRAIRITLSARGYKVRVDYTRMPLSLTSFSSMVVRSSNLSRVSCRLSAPNMTKRGERLYFRACETYDLKITVSLFPERRIIDPTMALSQSFVARSIVSC